MQQLGAASACNASFPAHETITNAALDAGYNSGRPLLCVHSARSWWPWTDTGVCAVDIGEYDRRRQFRVIASSAKTERRHRTVGGASRKKMLLQREKVR